MKNSIAILAFLLTSFTTIYAQQTTISGYVRDKSTGEELIGATVYIPSLKQGTTCNIYGFYSITVPSGSYEVEYSFIGFVTVKETVDLTENVSKNVELATNTASLQEVVIEGEASNKNVEDVEMSTVELKMETIKKIPALMGEVDVLRSIQLMPGVQSGGEGSTGFFVRGGGLDQNLILLDEAPVYNSSHLLGFFSVFNQDAIKDAKLYKGGIPSRYGGRLSSVLDVHMKDGNSKKFSGSGGIGMISSRLTLEGPIAKNKASFIVSGRRTYADLFLKASKNEDLKKSRLFFYDLNGKVNWRINQNNRVFLSAYTGRDIFGTGDLFEMGYGNQTVTARWNHLFGERYFSNFIFLYSNFDYSVGVPESADLSFTWSARIKDYGFKNDHTFYINKNNTLRFGVATTLHEFLPAKVDVGEGTGFSGFELPTRYALESGIHISNEQRVGSRIAMEYGVRFSHFANVGIDTVTQYNEEYEPIGEDTYAKGDFYNMFSGFEPRFSLKYTLTENSSVKVSYNRINQYLHLASNSTGGAPLDIWIPSTPNVKPQVVDQIAGGYFHNFFDNKLETSVELFYKDYQNQIDFKDNAQLLLNPLLEGEIRQGDARSYGAEFYIRKAKGQWTGWISYTFSRAFRTIAGISNGNEYRANYDRPHNLAIVSNYELNKQINFGASWVLITGQPITIPTGKFTYQGAFAPVYTERNEARMPMTHRLDLSMTIDVKKKKEDQRWENSWSFSVYNVYWRKNPFAINFVYNEDIGQFEAQRTYLFGTIPSVTWNFKF